MSKSTTLKSTGRKKWAMDQKDFNTVKTLAGMNLTDKKIAEITGWSVNSVWKVKAHDTLEEYRAYTANSKRKSREQQMTVETTPTPTQPVSETVTEQAIPGYTKTPMAATDVMLLERITGMARAIERQAAAMERLADAWENTPSKKTGFFS